MVGDLVVNFLAQKDDSLAIQTVIDVNPVCLRRARHTEQHLCIQRSHAHTAPSEHISATRACVTLSATRTSAAAHRRHCTSNAPLGHQWASSSTYRAACRPPRMNKESTEVSIQNLRLRPECDSNRDVLVLIRSGRDDGAADESTRGRSEKCGRSAR